MRIHRAGRIPITYLLVISFLVNGSLARFASDWLPLGLGLTLLFVLCFLYFFRNPKRVIPDPTGGDILAAADGKIIAIEKTREDEHLGDERLKISTFMSPLNVHVNRNPVGGGIKEITHKPGKFLAAFHPKASLLNEHTSVLYGNGDDEILLRQIAGALARRIETYIKEGQHVRAGEEFGFIRFGSRVDLFLPTDCEVLVRIGDRVKAGIDILARKI